MARDEVVLQPPSSQTYQDIIARFLRGIHFRMPKHDYDYSVLQPLILYIEDQPWPEDLKSLSFRIAKWISLGVGYMFPNVSRNNRLHYSTFCLLVTVYDDILSGKQGRSAATNGLEATIGTFALRMIRGEEQATPLMDSLAACLREFEAFQGPYAASMGVKATIDYVDSGVLECILKEPPRNAVSFPRFLRVKTGLAEIWAHWAFPEDNFPESEYRELYLPAIPAMCDCIVFINDILSFYKETICGTERINFICNTAVAKDIELVQALDELIEYTIERVKEVRNVLAPHPKLLHYADGFLMSYVAWHFNESWRYHLDEMAILDADGKLVEGRQKL
ncbi:MAG: hypothetical protein Q9227_000573 [Pyrenula ochraceoflavens]